MASDSVSSYCIKEPRCGLCRFPLENGEPVVEGHTPTVFPFARHDADEAEEEGVAVHMCGSGHCTRGDPRVPYFHDECYRFRLRPVTPEFITATEYRFSPAIGEVSRRRRRIQRALARRLNHGFLSRLPWEISDMVARSLVREFAVVHLQEAILAAQSPESPARPSQKADLSHDIYAQYVYLEGVRYVRSLGNEPPANPDSGVRVYDAQDSRPTHKVYVGYDHLGIRDVFFTLPDAGALRSFDAGGTWWTELSREDGIRQVTAITDGLKIRHILDSTLPHCDPPVPCLSWPEPGMACRVTELEPGRGSFNGPVRMSSIDCNKPGIDGYSAAICGVHVSNLYAHSPGSDTSFYQEFDRVSGSALWVYMPVDQDEYVEELQAVQLAGVDRCIALTLSTSTGREAMFGPYLEHTELQARRILSTPSRPLRIYFNTWDSDQDDSWIRIIGVDCNVDTRISGYQDETDHRFRYPRSLVPAAPAPYTPYSELWYFTSCRMEGVTSVTCCVNKTARDRPVIGVLLGYENGHRSCLGQYRLDWALAPLRKDAVQALNIGVARSVEGFPYVAEVCVEDPPPDLLRWLRIPCHGRLKWLFSPRQCELRHYEE